MEAKSLRAIKIEDLVRFIRAADIPSARRSFVNFSEHGERISREIMREYEQLERGRY